MDDLHTLKLTVDENAADALGKAVEELARVDQSPWAWKWVTFALHDALYGFGVCAVTGTNPDRVTYTIKKTGEKKLLNFDEILRRAQDKAWMGQYVHSKTLDLTEEQKHAIDVLKRRLRNPMAHYIPSTRYIGLEGMPEVACHVLDVIEFLAVASGNLNPASHRSSPERVKALCDAGRRLAQASSAAKADQEEELHIQRLLRHGPAVEVHTEGGGPPAEIGAEVLALKDELEEAGVKVLKDVPEQEPTMQWLSLRLAGAVPLKTAKRLIDLVCSRIPPAPEGWETLTMGVDLFHIDTRRPFSLPDERDEAVAYLRKHLPRE